MPEKPERKKAASEDGMDELQRRLAARGGGSYGGGPARPQRSSRTVIGVVVALSMVGAIAIIAAKVPPLDMLWSAYFEITNTILLAILLVTAALGAIVLLSNSREMSKK